MTEPFLARPDMIYKDSYIAMWREFIAEKRYPSWNMDKLEAHFDEYVDVVHARETDPMPGYVPQSDYWLIVNGEVAGNTSIRHYLNAGLERFGGHIGYQIRPSMRRRGYGTLQCKLALDIMRQMGIPRALITCDDDNIGSWRIIEANGGVLQDKIDNGRGVLTRRYWVDTGAG